MKVVSLFSGCGALDLGLEQVHKDAPNAASN
jgi:site-specific DNA-cytosine methylase